LIGGQKGQKKGKFPNCKTLIFKIENGFLLFRILECIALAFQIQLGMTENDWYIPLLKDVFFNSFCWLFFELNPRQKWDSGPYVSILWRCLTF